MNYKGIEVDHIEITFLLKREYKGSKEIFIRNLLQNKLKNESILPKLSIKNPLMEVIFIEGPFVNNDNIDLHSIEDICQAIKEKADGLNISICDVQNNNMIVSFEQFINDNK